MKYHAPILALLSLVTSVCAEPESSDPGFSPIYKEIIGSMASSEDVPPGKFTPFGAQVPAAKMHKRQTCATDNAYMCSNSITCCPIGYDCETDGYQNWCCPSGQFCSGTPTCPSDHTDCEFINGGDGCCPTATTYCYYQRSTGLYGCLDVSGGGGSGGSGSPSCELSGYFPCADLSGCCPNGTTCVSGEKYCQKPCERGETECVGGCCPSGYQCDALRETCNRTVGGGGGLGESTVRVSTSSRVRRTSSTTLFESPATSFESPTPTQTEGFILSEETPFTTEEESSTSSRRTSTTRSAVPTNTVQDQTTAVGESGGSGVRAPVVFGLMVIWLFAAVRL